MASLPRINPGAEQAFIFGRSSSHSPQSTPREALSTPRTVSEEAAPRHRRRHLWHLPPIGGIFHSVSNPLAPGGVAAAADNDAASDDSQQELVRSTWSSSDPSLDRWSPLRGLSAFPRSSRARRAHHLRKEKAEDMQAALRAVRSLPRGTINTLSPRDVRVDLSAALDGVAATSVLTDSALTTAGPFSVFSDDRALPLGGGTAAANQDNEKNDSGIEEGGGGGDSFDEDVPAPPPAVSPSRREQRLISAAAAVAGWRKAALEGDAQAQFVYGLMHQEGRGVGRVDLAEAERWFRLAVAQGHSGAACTLTVVRFMQGGLLGP